MDWGLFIYCVVGVVYGWRTCRRGLDLAITMLLWPVVAVVDMLIRWID